jgi:hypothetical protein
MRTLERRRKTKRAKTLTPLNYHTVEWVNLIFNIYHFSTVQVQDLHHLICDIAGNEIQEDWKWPNANHSSN